MLESSTPPKIALSANSDSGRKGQDDQMLSLIAFGPSDEYMKMAGIKGEPEEEIEMSTQKDRYMKKYGGGGIDTALNKPIKEAAEKLEVSQQTISNIRAIFNHSGNGSNGKQDDNKFNLDPPDDLIDGSNPGERGAPEISADPPESIDEPTRELVAAPGINITPVINLHLPPEIVIKVKFVR